MKNIGLAIIMLLISSFFLVGQTTIPYKGFLAEATSVTGSSAPFTITLAVTDLSGTYDGSGITVSNLVYWQNCNRYTVASIVSQFPSQVVLTINNPDGAPAPTTQIGALIQEASSGSGHFIGGIGNDLQQCISSYYAQYLGVNGDPMDNSGCIKYYEVSNGFSPLNQIVVSSGGITAKAHDQVANGIVLWANSTEFEIVTCGIINLLTDIPSGESADLAVWQSLADGDWYDINSTSATPGLTTSPPTSFNVKLFTKTGNYITIHPFSNKLNNGYITSETRNTAIFFTKTDSIIVNTINFGVTVSTLDSLNKNWPMGTRVKVEDTGSEYLLQETPISEYQTDGIGQIGFAGNYFVLDKKDVLSPEIFGAKADFRRDSVSVTQGSKIITCTSCSFSPSDVGKVIAIKEARIDTAYSLRPVSMNAYISSYISSTQISIDSFVDITKASVEMLWGTNNWIPFQNMFAYAKSKKIETIELGAGTYYLSALGITLKLSGASKGLIQWGPIKLSGKGKNQTILKYGPEDVQRVNISDIVGYNALYMVDDGQRYFSDFSIVSADRATTESTNMHTHAILQEQRAEGKISLDMVNVALRGESDDNRKAWGLGIYSSRGGKWEASNDSIIYSVLYNLKDCYIQCNRQNISFFAQDGPTKFLHMTDVETNGGGAINEGTVTAAASISAGSNILTINDDYFSFYDLRTEYDNDRLPFVTLNGTTNLTVSSITSRNTAITTANSPSTFVNADFYWYLNSDQVEGHCMYIHPNVSLQFKNVRSINVNGRGISYYSSGGQEGRTRYFRLENYIATTQDGSIAEMGFIGNNINLGNFNESGFAEFKNSKVEVSLQAPETCKFKFYDTFINSNFTFINDTSLLVNCSGYARLAGSGKVYTITGGDFRVIHLEDPDGVYNIYNARCGTLDIEAGAYLNFNGGFLSTIAFPTVVSDLDYAMLSNFVVDKNNGLSYFTNRAPGDASLLRERMFIKNVTFSGKAVAGISSTAINPVGLFELPYTNNNKLITARTNIIQPSASYSINKDYQDLRHLVIPYTGLFNTISISNDSINEVLISEVGNINIFRQFFNSNQCFGGNVALRFTGANFKLYEGGNMRLNNRAVRGNKYYTFSKDVVNNIWIEQTAERLESLTQPTRLGINGEIVYNSNPDSDTIEWKYVITKNAVTGETESLSGASLPFEFDLNNGKPYLGFEESYYVNPNTLLTITVPLLAGGNETFTPGNYGELIGSAGGTGSIRLADGHIKINTLGASAALNTSSNITVSYQYVSSATWKAVYKKRQNEQLGQAISVTTDTGGLFSFAHGVTTFTPTLVTADITDTSYYIDYIRVSGSNVVGLIKDVATNTAAASLTGKTINFKVESQ